MLICFSCLTDVGDWIDVMIINLSILLVYTMSVCVSVCVCVCVWGGAERVCVSVLLLAGRPAICPVDFHLNCPSGLSRCAGGCVRPLLGSLPCGPLNVELHRPLVRAAPPGLRARPHRLRSLLLPERRHKPHPLQPHVHKVQRDVQSRYLFFWLAGALQLTDDPTQHHERENTQ